MQHYLVLQSNLVAISSELDNYPTEETDAYNNLNIFPDAIMRKDCLEDLLPFEERTLPRPPIIPACADCAVRNVSLMNYNLLKNYCHEILISIYIHCMVLSCINYRFLHTTAGMFTNISIPTPNFLLMNKMKFFVLLK
jgi:hypothetical protein